MWKAVRCPAALALLLVAAGVALLVQGVRATLSAPASEDVEVVDAGGLKLMRVEVEAFGGFSSFN